MPRNSEGMANPWLIRSLSTGYDPAERQNFLAKNARMLQDDEREQERHNMEKERLAMQKEELELRKATQNFTNEEGVVKWAMNVSPHINFESYPKFYGWMNQQPGGQRLTAVLPPPEQFKNREEFDAWHEPFKADVLKLNRDIEKGQTEFGKTALDMFGKPYHKLTPEEKQSVNASVEGLSQGKEKPDLFVDQQGRQQWLRPGQPIPRGWRKYEKPREESGEANVSKMSLIKKMLDEDFANLLDTDVAGLPKKMSAGNAAAYKRILEDAQRYGNKMNPRQAVNQALTDWRNAHPTAGSTASSGSARDQAIQWLKTNAPNHPVTEDNIQAVIKKLGSR